MTLWLILTILTAVAAFIIAAPFLRRKEGTSAPESGVEVYKDQLAEIEREKEQGLIDEAEANLARVEIERRILAAAGETQELQQNPPTRWHYHAVTGVAAIVILGSVGLYATIGQPGYFLAQPQIQSTAQNQIAQQTGAAQPAQQTAQTGNEREQVEALVTRLEQRMKDNPDDADGWRVLGWSYYNTGRYQKAVDAYRRGVELQKDNPTIRALYGEALVKAADGQVTDEALQTFEKVLALNPSDERGRFFKGMAKEQRGDNQGAIDEWMELYKLAPADAEWASDLRARIEQVAAQAGIDVKERLAEAKSNRDTAKQAAAQLPHPQTAARGPSAEDIENAKQMSTDDQQAMVRGMVDGLASRLESSPNDPDGWIMLIRSHIALNEQEKARAALERANKAFEAEPETQKRIAEAAQVMGVSLSKE